MTVVEKNLCQRSAKTLLNLQSCRTLISCSAFQLAKFTRGTNCVNIFAEIKFLQFLSNDIFFKSDCIYSCSLTQCSLHIAISRKTAHNFFYRLFDEKLILCSSCNVYVILNMKKQVKR